jgi:hypothetical protein
MLASTDYVLSEIILTADGFEDGTAGNIHQKAIINRNH